MIQGKLPFGAFIANILADWELNRRCCSGVFKGKKGRDPHPLKIIFTRLKERKGKIFQVQKRFRMTGKSLNNPS